MSHATIPPAPNSDQNTTPGTFVGKRLGPYTICLELASGGMASVFLARAGSSAEGAELVALKILHRHLAEQKDLVDMFVDEAHISSRIRHRNVCEVYGFGKGDDDTHYLAMEYLMGESLAAVFRRTSRRTMNLGQHAALIARVAADACAGLQAAHSLTDAKGKRLNVVHRDISPENLFVTYAGVTKVVDFGLARAKHQTHRTRTGVIKGKFAYVCPEALDGARVDQRADIWGLGVVVWEALTGRRLFRSESDMQTLAAVVDAPIPPPSSIRPGLPPALDRPVLRALSRNPAQRQSSAEELARELLASCPEAARVGDAQIADWMSGMFGSERRWKSQVIELVQALSRPENSLVDLDPDSAPTRIMTAPAPGFSRHPLPRKPRPWLVGAAAVSSLLAVATLARLVPPVERADARELPIPAAALVSAAPAPEDKGPEPIGHELRAKELPDGSGYLLEIVDPVPGKEGLVLRIAPQRPKRARAAPSAAPSPAPPPREPAEEDAAPPAWLRRAMEREHAGDLVGRWRVSLSRQLKQPAVNAPD